MKVRHCILRGQGVDGGKSTSAVVGGGAQLDRQGLVIEDTLIDFSGRENWFADGVQGSNLTVRRSEIVRGTDGVGLMTAAGNALIETSWIHDGAYATWTASTPEPKPSHANLATHNDGVQIQRGKNLTIRGNFIGGVHGTIAGSGDDYDTSCVMIGQAVDSSYANKIDNVLVEKNWFRGGAASVNLFYRNGNDLSGVTIRGNRFLRDRGYYILKGAGVKARIEGNVFDDTGAPVTIHNGG